MRVRSGNMWHRREHNINEHGDDTTRTADWVSMMVEGQLFLHFDYITNIYKATDTRSETTAMVYTSLQSHFHHENIYKCTIT